MADQDPHGHKHNESVVPASTPDEYYIALTNLIGEASKDPALLRNLVYVLARHNLKAGMTQSSPTLDPAQLQELERAIEHLKSDLAEQEQQPPDSSDRDTASGWDAL